LVKADGQKSPTRWKSVGWRVDRRNFPGSLSQNGLIAQLDSELRSGKIIQCDETPLQVLNEPDRPASSQSYMWVRRSGAPDHPIVLYDYAPSRAGSVAERLLKGFSGYLQTDDYAGYHATGRQQGITHVGCWAHACRKRQKVHAHGQSRCGHQLHGQIVRHRKAGQRRDQLSPSPAKTGKKHSNTQSLARMAGQAHSLRRRWRREHQQ
jgi:hypothetical protein